MSTSRALGRMGSDNVIALHGILFGYLFWVLAKMSDRVTAICIPSSVFAIFGLVMQVVNGF